MTNEEFMSKKLEIPKEICKFLVEVFNIMEQRGRVGTFNGISFEVRSKETPHNNPHVHAYYGEYEISIDIVTLEVIGKIPNKNKKYAVEWVRDNKEYLLTKWKEIAMVSKLPFTASALDFEKINI